MQAVLLASLELRLLPCYANHHTRVDALLTISKKVVYATRKNSKGGAGYTEILENKCAIEGNLSGRINAYCKPSTR